MSAPSLLYHLDPGSDAAAPPVLLLHGTGGNEHDLVSLGRSLAPGSTLLSPRGPVSEGGAARFFARLAEGRFDPTEVEARTHQLADFVAAAAAKHGLDLTRLIAVGFSNGANVAATLLQLRPEILGGGALLLRPMVVLDRPATAGSLTGRSVALLNGSRDPIVPLDHPPHLAALLEAGDAVVTSHLLPASHGLTAADLTIAERFFARS